MLLLIFHKKVIALRLGHSTEPQSYNNCRNGQRRGERKSAVSISVEFYADNQNRIAIFAAD